MMRDEQKPDSRPGSYFVSAIDGANTYLMAGPYDSHVDALADVQKASDIAYQYDERAHWMLWGTVRAEGVNCIGRLNKHGLM